MNRSHGKRTLAFCLSFVLAFACLPLTAAADAMEYTGAVLAAVNTNRGNTFATFTADRPARDAADETDAAPKKERMLPDMLIEGPAPLSEQQALQRQAQYAQAGVHAQAAADYKVGDSRVVISAYADSEGGLYRAVDMVCTCVSDTVTIWHESGDRTVNVADDERLAAEMDVKLPLMLRFFGDKRIDTDRDGKLAVFIYEIDGENVGGYFSMVDLVDESGKIGSVWFPISYGSNHCDCIHVQKYSNYDFILETCLHEYQHYIQVSYQYVGRSNSTALNSTEVFINEGFSTGAEYLFLGIDRYSDSFAEAADPSNGASFLHWEHTYGHYALAFVFSQYIRTRYAAMTNDLDSEIPGGGIYKKFLESRTPDNDDDSIALLADILYPVADYPHLGTNRERCRQLLVDFWTAVFCQEPEGIHGFNGENWANKIGVRALLHDMPAGRTTDPIRSGMAGFYIIPDSQSDTVRITKSSAELVFSALPQQGFVLRYDANGGYGAPQTDMMRDRYRIRSSPLRSGHDFLGWALTPDASTPEYIPDDSVTLTADTTLYAVWHPSPDVATDTTYPMCKHGCDNRSCYRFAAQSDGLYRIVHSTANDARIVVSLNGAWIDPKRERSIMNRRTAEFILTGGEVYDLYLEWSGTLPADDSETFVLTQKEKYYRLTYRFDHPLVRSEWLDTGKSVYFADRLKEKVVPLFKGWAYAPDALTPELLPGDRIVLTQDTTLYAVCTPEEPLPTDGSSARMTVQDGAFLFILRPDRDGIYTLQWQTEDAQTENAADADASLLDSAGRPILSAAQNAAAACTLHAGETYYLCGAADAPAVAAVCRQMPSVQSEAALTFSVGEKACFDLTLHGKTTYLIPDYTPAAFDGRTFTGWLDADTGEKYLPGDTITITADTVLTAEWENMPEVKNTYTRILLVVMPRVLRAFFRNLYLRINDQFVR